MSPQRIQRRRTKGWRMPEGAVYVGRGSDWGNPYRVGDPGVSSAQGAVDLYRRCFDTGVCSVVLARIELAGRDLACWCPLEDVDGRRVPCHADVLLDLANGAPS